MCFKPHLWFPEETRFLIPYVRSQGWISRVRKKHVVKTSNWDGAGEREKDGQDDHVLLHIQNAYDSPGPNAPDFSPSTHRRNSHYQPRCSLKYYCPSVEAFSEQLLLSHKLRKALQHMPYILNIQILTPITKKAHTGRPPKSYLQA